MTPTRLPIRIHLLMRALLAPLFVRPSGSFVEIDAAEVKVEMGWAFRARFPRSSVVSCSSRNAGAVLSLGVHGFAGSWLVNGSWSGLVRLQLEPDQRAYVLGVPVKLRELRVSMEQPDELVRLLDRAHAGDAARANGR